MNNLLKIKSSLVLLFGLIIFSSGAFATNGYAYYQTNVDRVWDASAEFVEVFATNDSRKLGKFYKRNGILKLPNASAISGRHNVASAWQAGFDQGIRSVALNIISIEEAGRNKVLENGTYVLDIETPNGIIQQEGTYSVLWVVPKRMDRRPKILFDAIDAN